MDKSGYKRKNPRRSNIVRGILAIILLPPLIWLIFTIIGNLL